MKRSVFAELHTHSKETHTHIHRHTLAPVFIFNCCLENLTLCLYSAALALMINISVALYIFNTFRCIISKQCYCSFRLSPFSHLFFKLNTSLIHSPFSDSSLYVSIAAHVCFYSIKLDQNSENLARFSAYLFRKLSIFVIIFTHSCKF